MCVGGGDVKAGFLGRKERIELLAVERWRTQSEELLKCSFAKREKACGERLPVFGCLGFSSVIWRL